MVQLYIHSSCNVSKYANIVELFKKQFNVSFFNCYDGIKGSIQESDFVIIRNKIDIKNKQFISLLSFLKYTLYNCNTVMSKMSVLYDIFKGVPCLIVSCGPSSNYDMEKIKSIQDRYVIVGVKYVRDRLLKAGIDIDVTITSFWWNKDLKCNVTNPNENNTISYHNTMVRKIKEIKKDIYVLPNSKFNHRMTFERIRKYKNIDIIKTTPNRIQQKGIECPLGHIMLETALPAVIHMGCNEIYTLGWDGSSIVNGKKQYTYGGDKVIHNNLCCSNVTEYTYMQSIQEMFNKVGKQLYKVSDKSPIQLPLKELV